MNLEDSSVAVDPESARDLIAKGWTCSICLGEETMGYGEGRSDLVALPCLHIFDRECMWRWIAKGGGKCPLCNYDIKRA